MLYFDFVHVENKTLLGDQSISMSEDEKYFK